MKLSVNKARWGGFLLLVAMFQVSVAFANVDLDVDGATLLCPQFDCFRDFDGSGTVECCFWNGASPTCVDDGSMNGFYGTCTRSNDFTKVTIGSKYTGDTTTYNSPIYVVDSGDVMVLEPIISGQTKPGYLLTLETPLISGSANWMLIHWDNGGTGSLVGNYVPGVATVNPAAAAGGLGVELNGQWDVNGNVYWAGDVPMRGTWDPYAQNPGLYVASGNSDSEYLNGAAYFNSGMAGFYAALDGGTPRNITRMTAFYPEQVIDLNDIAGQTFAAMMFDNNAGAGVTQPIRLVTSAVGANLAGAITFTVQDLDDVDTPVVGSDFSLSWHTRTTDANYPNDGMFGSTGTTYNYFTGTGNMAGNGKIICMMNYSAIYGYRIFCSGQSPDDANRPFSIIASLPTTNTASDLISAFGTSGVATTSFGENSAYATSLATRERDGSPEYLIAGSVNDGKTKMAIARFDSDGNLDTDFSTDGMRLIDLGDTWSGVNEVLYDSSNRIYLVGYGDTGGNIDLVITRLLDDGSDDTSFGSSGVVRLDFGLVGTDIYARGAAFDPAGNIVVVGNLGGTTAFVAKVTAAGAAVGTFGTSGIAQFDKDDWSGSGTTDSFEDVVVDSDGTIIASGLTNTTESIVIRLDEDGVADTGFNTDGFAYSSSHGAQRGVVLVPQLDSGREYVTAGGATDHETLKFQNDGDLDTSYNSGGGVPGKLTADIGSGSADYANDIAVQFDNKYITVGRRTNGGRIELAVQRINTDGSYDGDFNTTGYRTYQLTPANTDEQYIGTNVVIDSFGRIVVGGNVWATAVGSIDEFTLTMIQP